MISQDPGVLPWNYIDLLIVNNTFVCVSVCVCLSRGDMNSRLKEKEIHLEAQRQRSLAVMSENSDLRLQLSSCDGKQSALVQRVTSLQDAVQRNKQDTHLMRLMFEEYRSQFDKNMVVIGQNMVQVFIS